MALGKIEERTRKFVPSLEGVRGYGFLLIFLAHYLEFAENRIRQTWWLHPVYLFGEVAWVMVPAFFVLSGYLIGGILLATRDRPGYFKVFYARRILRVFPIYYLTLIVVAVFDSLNGVQLSTQFWSHFFYIHNLLPSYRNGTPWQPAGQVIHLWSMAVEEQFYLAWPLMVWLFRGKRALLRVTWILIGASCVLRFVAPLIQVSPLASYFWTPTRADAILLGVVLAMTPRQGIFLRLEPLAKYVALAGFAGLLVVAVATGGSVPETYLGTNLLIPVGNITAAAVIVAVREEGSFLSRICSMKWICWLGSLSYGLYLFHMTYAAWFMNGLVSRLTAYMPHSWAFVLCMTLAFCLTLLLAMVSYRFVEGPVMNLKGRLKYGAVEKLRAPHSSGLTEMGD